MEKPRVRTRVTLIIELDSGSVWGADTSMGQIFQQSEEETLQKVQDHILKIGARVFGKPKVIAILAEGQ